MLKNTVDSMRTPQQDISLVTTWSNIFSESESTSVCVNSSDRSVSNTLPNSNMLALTSSSDVIPCGDVLTDLSKEKLELVNETDPNTLSCDQAVSQVIVDSNSKSDKNISNDFDITANSSTESESNFASRIIPISNQCQLEVETQKIKAVAEANQINFNYIDDNNLSISLNETVSLNDINTIVKVFDILKRKIVASINT